MQSYTYNTATGPVSIEVDEKWRQFLMEADAAEANNNRCHTRADHKYAPGEPVSLDSLEYEGEWFADRSGNIESAEFSADLERALETLTDLQRRYFVMARLEGYSYAEIARIFGKTEATVRGALKAADRKMKLFFG